GARTDLLDNLHGGGARVDARVGEADPVRQVVIAEDEIDAAPRPVETPRDGRVGLAVALRRFEHVDVARRPGDPALLEDLDRRRADRPLRRPDTARAGADR